MKLTKEELRSLALIVTEAGEPYGTPAAVTAEAATARVDAIDKLAKWEGNTMGMDGYFVAVQILRSDVAESRNWNTAHSLRIENLERELADANLACNEQGKLTLTYREIAQSAEKQVAALRMALAEVDMQTLRGREENAELRQVGYWISEIVSKAVGSPLTPVAFDDNRRETCPCSNEKCELFKRGEDQNCAGENNHGDPAPVSCMRFVPTSAPQGVTDSRAKGLHIELGKTYLSRSGAKRRITGIITENLNYPGFVFISENKNFRESFRVDGRFHEALESPWDLIEEVPAVSAKGKAAK